MMSTTSLSVMPPSKRAPDLDASIRAVLAVYIAALPFKALLIVQRNGFLVLIALLVGWCAANRRFFYSRTPYDMLLLAFVVWVGLTIPFAVAPLYSLKEYGKLLEHMVVFYSVIFFFKELCARQVLVGLIGIVAAAVTVYGLSQFNLQKPQAVVSFLSAEVWLTTFLVMVIPFALVVALSDGSLKVRSGGAVISGLMVVCLFSTQSRAGLVALVGEVWVIAWFLRSVSSRIFAMLVTVGAIAMTALVFNASTTGVSADIVALFPPQRGISSAMHRLQIWQFSLLEIAKHWLVGIGYGNLSYLFLYDQAQEVFGPCQYCSVQQTGTHNIFLYLALHVGVPGMLLFGCLLAWVILRTSAEYRDAYDWLSKTVLLGTVGSVVGVMLRLQFDQMFVGSLAVFFWVLLALAVLSYPSCNRVAAEA